MSAQPQHAPRRSWRVVRAMMRELERQRSQGFITDVGSLDEYGRCDIAGRLDLAALAYAAELSLKREFGG